MYAITVDRRELWDETKHTCVVKTLSTERTPARLPARFTPFVRCVFNNSRDRFSGDKLHSRGAWNHQYRGQERGNP